MTMKKVKKRGLSTQPCGVPVLKISDADVDSPKLITLCLLMGKSWIQEKSGDESPRLWSFRANTSGRTVLKAELKSTNNILTYVLECCR